MPPRCRELMEMRRPDAGERGTDSDDRAEDAEKKAGDGA